MEAGVVSARACAPAGAAMPPTARPPRAAAAGAAPATPSRPAKPSAAATPVTPGSGQWPIPGQRARSSSKDELDLDDILGDITDNRDAHRDSVAEYFQVAEVLDPELKPSLLAAVSSTLKQIRINPTGASSVIL